MSGYYDFTLDRGATFKRTLGWRVGGLPVDVTGYQARIELRRSTSQANPDYVLTSEPDGGISIGNANGRIDVNAKPEWTTDIKSGIYFYRLDIWTGSEVNRLLEGRATVREGVKL